MTADDKLDAIAAVLEKLSDRLDILERIAVPPTVPTRTLTAAQVARVLRVDPSEVSSWIHKGTLEAADVSGPWARRPRWRIAPEHLMDFVQRRTKRLAAAGYGQVTSILKEQQ